MLSSLHSSSPFIPVSEIIRKSEREREKKEGTAINLAKIKKEKILLKMKACW